LLGARCDESKLARTVFGIEFPNPIGLAAGFDKNAVALLAWEALGFGFVEAGTVTGHPQPGNPKPRLFRYPSHGALINRMGFNNEGAGHVAARLEKLHASAQWPRIPIGINIGKSKITPLANATADYLTSLERVFPFGDYFVLNVSSPNTPGLRSLQEKTALDELMREVQSKNRHFGQATIGETERSTRDSEKTFPTGKPVLIKIAPDLELSQIEDIIELAEIHQLAGIVATNTTLDHSALAPNRDESGGLSGEPLRQRSTKIVRFISSRTALPVIASGGVVSAEAALEKFDAGAVLIQLYTGFIYRGPALIREIADALFVDSVRG
jgi:dihydroorotate dehydrogenase